MVTSDVPPAAEYALFDPEEIDLRALEPARIYEHGYETDAQQALARLEALGITPDLARQCAGAMHPNVTLSYAKGAVRAIGKWLTARELFDGMVFDETHNRYSGTFLDLAALAEDLEIENAHALLHALYLVAELEGEDESAEVRLSTFDYTKERRAGERTYRRVRFDQANELPLRLRELGRREVVRRGGMSRDQLLDWLAERATQTDAKSERDRFRVMYETVERRDPPQKGPLAEKELWNLELALRDERSEGVDEALTAFEKSNGRTPGTTYLRLKMELAQGPENAQVLAEKIAALSLSMSGFPELSLLAAEAWMRAKDPRKALPFAKDLQNALSVDEDIRDRADAIVLLIEGPPPRAASKNPSLRPTPLETPRATSQAPEGSSSSRKVQKAKQYVSSEILAPRAQLRDARSERPEKFGAGRSSYPPGKGAPIKGASRPPYEVESGALTFPSPPVPPRTGELVASLPLPEGYAAEVVSPDHRPKNAIDARAHFTLLARELGDQYNRELGIVLRTNLEGVEAVQAVLFERYPDRALRDVDDLHDAIRHGAFMSELIARTLDGVWEDMSSEDIGDWSMVVPPNLRVWPFGRVLRLISKGHKERDLVSYFLELSALRARA